GLDVPVHISMGHYEQTIAPGQKVEAVMEKGPYRVHVTGADGATLDDDSVEVPGGTDFVAVNVLGAAPLYVEEVIYTQEHTKGRDPEHTLYSGQKFITRDGVRWVFTTPPEQLDMSKTET